MVQLAVARDVEHGDFLDRLVKKAREDPEALRDKLFLFRLATVMVQYLADLRESIETGETKPFDGLSYARFGYGASEFFTKEIVPEIHRFTKKEAKRNLLCVELLEKMTAIVAEPFRAEERRENLCASGGTRASL